MVPGACRLSFKCALLGGCGCPLRKPWRLQRPSTIAGACCSSPPPEPLSGLTWADGTRSPSSLISYPRTETDRFSPDADLRGTIQGHSGNSTWGGYCQSLLGVSLWPFTMFTMFVAGRRLLTRCATLCCGCALCRASLYSPGVVCTATKLTRLSTQREPLSWQR